MIEKKLSIGIDISKLTLDICVIDDDVIDHYSIQNKTTKIIDEMDEMLNLGFRTQLKGILDLLTEKRQNLLFSVTMTEEVEALIEDFFNRPVKKQANRFNVFDR